MHPRGCTPRTPPRALSRACRRAPFARGSRAPLRSPGWCARLPPVPRGPRLSSKPGAVPASFSQRRRMEEMRALVDVCSDPPNSRVPAGSHRMKFADVTPNLVVASVERSLAFYRDLLGFSLLTTVPENGPFAFAWMQRDGVNV